MVLLSGCAGFFLVVVSLLSLVIGEEDTHFSSSPQTVRVNRGEDAILQCAVKNLDKSDRVAWIRTKDVTILSIDNYVLSSDNHVTVSTDFAGQFNLHINNVTSRDAGNYRCMVTSSPPVFQTTSLKLIGAANRSARHAHRVSRLAHWSIEIPPHRRPPHPPIASYDFLRLL